MYLPASLDRKYVFWIDDLLGLKEEIEIVVKPLKLSIACLVLLNVVNTSFKRTRKFKTILRIT